MIEQALLNVLQIDSILGLTLGIIAGIMLGSLPGLTATMGVALFLPITFGMEPIAGILLLIGIYFGGVYGGSITAILLRTPGTPAAAATAIDGYALAQQGYAKKALILSTLSSGIGGIGSVFIIIFLAPILAGWALNFSAPETFALALFGLSIISSVSGKSMVKGLIMGFIGLLVATIGMDPVTGVSRFTYGSMNLMNGLNFIPILIGLFAASEAFKSMETIFDKEQVKVKINNTRLKLSEFKSLIVTFLRSTGLGALIGIIPGSGPDVSAFVSYNEAKRFSKNKEKFGNGSMEGIAAAETANNATTGGAMIPLLTLGIPGDAVTAILLGAFMIQGIQPGPFLFTDHGVLVNSLFVGMIFANILMVIFGLLGIRYFVKVLSVPKQYLGPVILILCVVGAYALNNSFFDVWVMLGAGVIGYFLQRYEYPASPVILALILGPIAESNFRRALSLAGGDYSIFYTRPISAILIILAILTFILPIIRYLKELKGNNKLTKT